MAGFDMEIAREMTEAFAAAAGMCCRLLDKEGRVVYREGSATDECAYLRALPGPPPPCEDIHTQGLRLAERFGGRYIYSCAAGLTYFSAPIMGEGVLTGGLVAGPVLISDVEDCMDDIIVKRDLPACEVRGLHSFLASLPQVTTARLRHLSVQLFASAVYISDSGRELYLNSTGLRQQRSIGEYLERVKETGRPTPYPIDKEQAMLAAVGQGDRATAAALLNELLGHVFFLSPDHNADRTRLTELVALMSRAAVNGGASVESALLDSHRSLLELDRLKTLEETARWLERVLDRFTGLVYDVSDSKHKNVIRQAVSYLNTHYGRNVTLDQVAEHVGYSPSHFSKVFKEEMGCGFRTYLNQLRVERSKALLLAGSLPIAEICERCGFEDQSYHCKVFKKLVGVTPDKYRKQSRRIDDRLEYGG